jgi:hypothetical protein
MQLSLRWYDTRWEKSKSGNLEVPKRKAAAFLREMTIIAVVAKHQLAFFIVPSDDVTLLATTKRHKR